MLITLSYCSINTTLRCATIPWDPSSSYNIPNDSNTYTLDSRQTLSSDLSVSGILELLYSGIIVNPGHTITMDTSSSSIDVKTGAALYNYYGNISMTDPSAMVTIRKAGKIDNVRGSIIDYLTIDSGGNFSDGIKINLDNDLDIDFSWTFTNKAIINGGGHTINLGTNGAIIIENNASILFEDLTLNKVSGNKIRCTDDSSTVSLNNVNWIQDTNFSFTKGKLYILGDLNITGNYYTFSYETDQVSTVTNNASINLKLATLKYNSSSNNLLSLNDISSIIYLDRSTLLASQACTLSSGTLISNGNSILQGIETLNLSGLGNIKFIDGINQIGNVILA